MFLFHLYTYLSRGGKTRISPHQVEWFTLSHKWSKTLHPTLLYLFISFYWEENCLSEGFVFTQIVGLVIAPLSWLKKNILLFNHNKILAVLYASRKTFMHNLLKNNKTKMLTNTTVSIIQSSKRNFSVLSTNRKSSREFKEIRRLLVRFQILLSKSFFGYKKGKG